MNITEEKHPGRGIGKTLLEYLELIIFAMVAVILICIFLFRMVRVEGTSMLPSLEDGDVLVSSRLFYQPERGDVVVVTKPNEISSPLIKRIVAVGGDTLDIDFEAGQVVLNGEPLEEPYIAEPTQYQPEDSLEFPLTVPEGMVFAMGDNRNHSSDSRDARIGLIDERYLMGRTVWRIFPFSRFGRVPSE